MAAIETLASLTGRIRLANGTTTSGAVRTVNQSFGSSLNKSAWDADKAMNIVSAMEDILDKEINDVQAVKTYTVREE